MGTVVHGSLTQAAGGHGLQCLSEVRKKPPQRSELGTDLLQSEKWPQGGLKVQEGDWRDFVERQAGSCRLTVCVPQRLTLPLRAAPTQPKGSGGPASWRVPWGLPRANRKLQPSEPGLGTGNGVSRSPGSLDPFP